MEDPSARRTIDRLTMILDDDPIKKTFPRYRGKKWIRARLPEDGQLWLHGKHLSAGQDQCRDRALRDELVQLVEQDTWKWPRRNLYFFSDLHADADAFIASLVASGGVEKTGIEDEAFKLTRMGSKARFVIGGDCFDKGPSNLRLLRSIRMLIDKGARVQLLAGNHDIRVKLGIRSVGLKKDARNEHFFIRMGAKSIPFLKEICEHYSIGGKSIRHMPSAKECKRHLYPSSTWFDEFPKVARKLMPEKGIERELDRMRKKIDTFEEHCDRVGLSPRLVFAAALQWQDQFLDPKGEFYWFFKRMRLACRRGSFLFVHAGIDDRIANVISEKGIRFLNKQYKERLDEAFFEFYYGPLANTIRTKYRDIDMPFTKQGVKLLKKDGIHAIVHGHKNLYHGQRIMLRKGLVNFECDASIDRNTRKKEGLPPHGAAVTIFRPEGVVLGISTDHPYIKAFKPGSLTN